MIRNIFNQISKTNETALAVIVFLFVFLVLQLCQKPFWDTHITGGDEPIYMAITYSIVHNKTINLSKFLSQKQWQSSPYDKAFDKSIIDWKLTPPAPQANRGTQFSIHNFGFPLVIALPFYIAGRLGAVIFTQIIGALIAVNIFYICRLGGLGKLGSMFVAMVMSLSLPLSIYSYLMFSDILAALLITYAFQSKSKIMPLIAAAYLPFIKIKYLFQTIIFFLIFWWEKKNKTTIAIIAVISLLLLSLFCKYAYGSFSPFVIRDTTVSFGSANGLLGLLLDWRVGLLTHAPYYILALPGITMLFYANRQMFWKWCAIVLPYYLMVGLYGAWHGDHAPPARHLVAILPLFAAPLASLLSVKKRLIKDIAWVVFVILSVVSLALSYYGIAHPGSLYLDTKDNIGLLIKLIWTDFNVANIFPTGGNYDARMWTWAVILIILLVSPILVIKKNITWKKKNP